MDLAPDFNEFCGLLTDRHVEFVIVGAHALAFHGAPRYTGDLDVLVRPSVENATRLLAALKEFGFPTSGLSADQVIDPRRVIEMGIVPVQIHVMGHVDGVTWDEVWQGRQAGQFGDRVVWFIGRDEYVRNKRAAGRPKDLADLDAIGER